MKRESPVVVTVVMTISGQWAAKWPHIVSMFDLPLAIREASDMTNTIESVNSTIRL